MAPDEHHDSLFTLAEPGPAAATDRTLLTRQALAGVVLVMAAVAAAWLLPAVLSDGPLQSDDTVLLVDGEPHTAQTSAERESMLWFDESLADPSCVVRDAAGDEIATSATDRTERRHLGSPGDWVGVATFAPTSDSVEVTCTGVADGAVLVSQAPGGTAGLVAIGAIILVPLSLALAGLVLLVAVATSLVQARAAARR